MGLRAGEQTLTCFGVRLNNKSPSAAARGVQWSAPGILRRRRLWRTCLSQSPLCNPQPSNYLLSSTSALNRSAYV